MLIGLIQAPAGTRTETFGAGFVDELVKIPLFAV